MTDFHDYRIVTARKPHRCEHCHKPIEIGEKYRSCAQVWEGDFQSYSEHIECHAAWRELNFDLRGIDYCEGAPFLFDDDHENDDKMWICETHPVVGARLGWSAA